MYCRYLFIYLDSTVQLDNRYDKLPNQFENIMCDQKFDIRERKGMFY